MESFQISTGLVSVPIKNELGEIRGHFNFRPADAMVYSRMLELINKVNSDQLTYSEREKKCTTEEERVNLFIEVCDNYKAEIDSIYGKGSSQILFDGAYCFEMFDDFFRLMKEKYGEARKKATSKYKK